MKENGKKTFRMKLSPQSVACNLNIPIRSPQFFMHIWLSIDSRHWMKCEFAVKLKFQCQI